MGRLVWLAAGFIVGVICSRNAEPMSAPETGAVFLGLVLAAALTWWAGRRDKTTAIATAVATAVAAAEARAEAQAQAQAAAIAQAAVHLHWGAAAPPPPNQAWLAAAEAQPAAPAGHVPRELNHHDLVPSHPLQLASTPSSAVGGSGQPLRPDPPTAAPDGATSR